MRDSITKAQRPSDALYTANPQWIRKLDRLVEQNPEQFEMYRQEKMDGRVISKMYRFPKRFITVRSKDTKRKLTDEQRAELTQRMRDRKTRAGRLSSFGGRGVL